MMRAIIDKYQIKSVWHFTDKSNLPSIRKQGGLLSLHYAETQGIAIPSPGGNEWSHDADRIKGVDEYVHLAFIKEHPMLFLAKQKGRIPDPIWLEIHSSVILDEEARFCSDVSNKSGVPILNAEQAKQKIDFEVLFTFMDWGDPSIQNRRQEAVKSEILIPNFISIDNIINI